MKNTIRQFFTSSLNSSDCASLPVKTNDGRIDSVVETDDHIYLFEFKLDQDASALQQVKEHEYYRKYQLHGKPITCMQALTSTTSAYSR
ncbi:MAG: PD-(D/E)XK nuclease domain-containing protein [Caldilineaceae bacterium]